VPFPLVHTVTHTCTIYLIKINTDECEYIIYYFILLYIHRDLPQSLQESGGWINEETILSYAEYARLVFGTLGDRVKTWITFNEPYTFCYHGYSSGTFAPGIKDPATGPYDCVHTILKAHATAYQLYQEQFFKKDKGKIGISLDNFWQEPADPTSPNDIKAAEQSYMFRVRFACVWSL